MDAGRARGVNGPKNIVLVGFMACGKTTAGRNLSLLMNRRFVDLDEQIEMREGCGIPEIFSRKGEAYFRGLEREILRYYSVQSGLVIACGGGAVKDPVNVGRLQMNGVVYCLTARPDTILERTARCRHRPLLAGPDREQRLNDLLRERSDLYSQFPNQVSTDDRESEEVAREIIAHYSSLDSTSRPSSPSPPDPC